ncbi:hypothetical protein F441_21061 [Phytophthora nicotianae CJ01A1]|uniref:Uncharacterized protein n=2 Tax=Phytophthora nicotianae TaxID=4792 RepID=W2VVL5_PHYNI|nr:hypothetical protein F444_21201 [Phytophthora nicotianae P1976]ETP01753.1 hypothetical protein F441_21061 [Phytophthora nicotianae CJ01A1]
MLGDKRQRGERAGHPDGRTMSITRRQTREAERNLIQHCEATTRAKVAHQQRNQLRSWAPNPPLVLGGEHRHSVNGHVQSNGELHALNEVVPVELRTCSTAMEHIAA